MTVFFVVTTEENQGLADRVRQIYSAEIYRVSSTAWLVSDENVTPAQVCEKLGIGENGFTNAIVTKVGGYFGHASNAIWQWLNLKGVSP